MEPAVKVGINDITVLVINYRTLDLTERCVSSLQLHYPGIRMILVDNGSQDESTDFIRSLGEASPNIQAILRPQNIHHGPALHHAVLAADTRFIFSLDSDCQILQAGFLEKMVAFFNDPRVYAVGRRTQMNRFGYELDAEQAATHPYIHPAAMLLDREKYRRLKPFIHHGSPALQNMRSATQAGWLLVDFPITEMVYHQGRGTCSRYGYGLGWRHVIEYLIYRLTN